jgi:hypothetical protein
MTRADKQRDGRSGYGAVSAVAVGSREAEVARPVIRANTPGGFN